MLAATATARSAIAGRLAAGEPACDDRRRAAYAGIDLNRILGAIKGAGPAFHTSVFVYKECFFIDNLEYSMRADIRASAASDAFLTVKRECRDIVQVSQFHFDLLPPKRWTPSSNAPPMAAAPTIRGNAFFISFSTPDGDV